MAIIHLKKMCVGVQSIDELEELIAQRRAEKKRAGLTVETIHTTRQMPKRAHELIQGGSIFWIIKKKIQARQEFLEIRQDTDEDGKNFCQLVLDPQLIPVTPKRHGRFQGWRYLTLDKAPADIGAGDDVSGTEDMPAALKIELAALGLL